MRPFHTSHRRRGTVTVIVVAFLSLMLILGLSFAFYALREAEESRTYRDAMRGGQTGVSPTLRTPSGIDDPPEPDSIANRILGDVIYGPPDDLSGAFNSLRQHDMARGIYGWNPKFPSPYWPYAAPQPANFNPNMAAIQPFNGLGRVPAALIGATSATPTALPPNMMNFAWVSPPEQISFGLIAMLQGRMFNIDNNYDGDPRNGAPAPWSYNPAPGNPPSPLATDRYWAKNADYTYPDENNFFLAAIDPASGRVLMQSYYRPWLINGVRPPNPEEETPPRNGPTNATMIPADPNDWINSVGRLKMLRPRPVDHQWPPGSGQSEWRYPLPNPDGSFGDVELLTGKSIGRYYDAQWIDMDLPVRTWRGKNYKPMVAMLILDLDGRINLNTAGNFYPDPNNPGQWLHGSNQGVGPWEVNPSRVMLTYPAPGPNPMPPPALLYPPGIPRTDDGAALALGTGTVGHGKYGVSWLINPPNPPQPILVPLKQYGSHTMEITDPNNAQQIGENQPAPGSGAHWYGMVDYLPRTGQGQYSSDDVNGRTTAYTWGFGAFGQAFTGQPGNPANPPRPHDNNRYGSGYYVPSPVPGQFPIYDERSNHPSLFNPFLVRSRSWIDLNPGTPAAPRIITNRAFGVDELRNLNAQYNFAVSRSSELARLAPNTLGNPAFRIDPANGHFELNARFVTTPLSNDIDLPGYGPASITNYQTTVNGQGPVAPPRGTGSGINPANPVVPGTAAYDDSFRTNWNSSIGPMDLQRRLTEYRADLNRPLGPGNLGNWQRAIADRQQMAADIFKRLRIATGETIDPNSPPTAGNPTQRWLAQLAVNIVDFIDSDECITPFRWTQANGGDPNGLPLSNEQPNQIAQYSSNQVIKDEWVFGFERPRVVINEAYIHVDNDPTDTLKDPADGSDKAQKDFDMMMWLELHNPITPGSQAEQMSGPEGYLPPPSPNVDDNTHGGYRAPLKDIFAGGTGEKSIYRVLVSKVGQGAPQQDPLGMTAANNIAGIPTQGVMNDANGQPLVVVFDRGGGNMTVKDDSGGTVIHPNVGAQYRPTNPIPNFYLVGPEKDQPGAMMGMGMGKATIPGAQADLTTTSLQAKVDRMMFPNRKPNWWPGFTLQRLACPALPPGVMNPYVTTDYWESSIDAINNRLKVDAQGNAGGNNPGGTVGQLPDWSDGYSWGRRQPYDGVVKYDQMNAQYYRQDPQGITPPDQVHHTFGQHNGRTGQGQNQWPNPGDTTLELPFRPLAHFDRVPISPAELFQVVGCKPHELTHVFFDDRPPAAGPTYGLDPLGRLKYTADWLDHPQPPTPGAPAQPPQPGVPYQGTFLYRAAGLLRTPTPLEGLGMGGRVPGKININTIFNQEVFNAICDAQQNGPNRFQQQGPPWSVNSAWNQLLAVRNEPLTPPGQIKVGKDDRPFRGYGIETQFDRHRTLALPDMLWSQNDANMSKENYLAGPNSGGMGPGRASAVEKYELMSKTMNQFTTRSNCFAVYMMIGYFEVRNPGPWNEANRPILGKELGVDDGTITRHKFFSIIDRTNLSIEPTPLVAPGATIPPIRQGQAPVYFSYQPNKPLAAPPLYTVAGVTEDPQPVPPAPVQVKVPAIGTDAAGRVVGYYDGTLWTLKPQNPGNPNDPYSQILLDVGDRQEGPFPVLAVGYDPFTNSAVITLPPMVKEHFRGASMRLINPDPFQPPSTPGNPGPQPGFNYKSSRYSPVIKYVEQLK